MLKTLVKIINLIIVLSSGFVPGMVKSQTLPKADLVLWHQQGDDVIKQLGIAKIFDEWAKTNAPGSTLTLVQKYDDDLTGPFQAAARANAAPDLLWVDAKPILTLAAAPLIQPTDQVIDAALFMPAIVGAVRFNGKLYGVPLQAGNQLMLFYNRQFISEAPKTFAELIDLGMKLQKQNATVEGFTALAYSERESLWVFPIAFGFGATIFGSDGKSPALDTRNWIDAYQLIYDFRFKYKVAKQDCDYECADLNFRAGTAAMIFSGDWALTGKDGYINTMGDKLGIAAWPSVGADPAQNIPAPFIVGQYLAIPTNTTGDKFSVAAAFAKFLASDQVTALAWTVPNYRLPALLSALHSDTISKHPVLSQTRRALESGVIFPTQPEMACIFPVVTLQTRLLMNDSIKPGEAAREGQKAAVECIAKLNEAPATPTK